MPKPRKKVSTNKYGEKGRSHVNNWMLQRQKWFRRKIWERKDHNKRRINKQHGNIIANARRRFLGEHTPLETISKLEKPWPSRHVWIFVLKKFTSIHDKLATEMNICIKKNADTRMDNQREKHFYPKRPIKRTTPIKYRSITCLQMIWKILTAQIRKVWYTLINRGIFHD